jgi:hypothetical protein
VICKENNKHSFVDKLIAVYCFLGCVGGAVFGYLSLGLTGLAVGLLGGAVLGFISHRVARLVLKSDLP